MNGGRCPEAAIDYNQRTSFVEQTRHRRTTRSFSLRNGDLTMYQKILLAYDGSPDGREALAQVRNLACMSGATVRLLAIIDPSENMLVVEGMSFVPDNQRFVVQSVLDAGVRAAARAPDVRQQTMLEYGNPAEQIVLSAREMNADLIVVGHRDQGDACTLAEWLGRRVHPASCAVQRACRRQIRAHARTTLPQSEKAQAQGKG